MTQFKCMSCDRHFTKLSSMKNHQKVHIFLNRAYKNSGASSGRILHKSDRHTKRRRFHGQTKKITSQAQSVSRSFKCLSCHRLFSKLSSLKNHQKVHASLKRAFGGTREKPVHSEEDPSKCTYCDRVIHNKRDRARHEGTHGRERPFECIECGRTFRLRGHLKDHMKAHVEKTPHKCRFC